MASLGVATVVTHPGRQKPSCVAVSVTLPLRHSCTQLHRGKSWWIFPCFLDLQVTLRLEVSFTVHIPALSRRLQFQLQKFLILIYIYYKCVNVSEITKWQM